MFDTYDEDKSGFLDYNEFAAIIFGHSDPNVAANKKLAEGQSAS